MAHENLDDGLIRQYLLGQLGEDELRQLEEKMMADNELFDRVLLAEDEMVEAYVQGELPESDRAGFEASFLSTPEGRQQVGFAKALSKHVKSVSPATDAEVRAGGELVAKELVAERPPAEGPVPEEPSRGARVPRPAWWEGVALVPYFRLAIAAVIVVGLGLGIWRVFFYQSEVSKGLAALNRAYHQQRPIEPRISGFDYAPIPVTRDDASKQVDTRSLNRAERILLDEVAEHPSAASHHALGRLYLAEQKFDDSIREFDEALKTDPNNAQLHGDYGAALLEKGKQSRLQDDPGKSLEEFARALEQLNRALDLDSLLLEALFNRAILYDNMGLLEQAAGEWRRYLEKDSNSKWADEASRKLKELEEKKIGRSQDEAEHLPGFVEAFQSKNDDRAFELMSRNTEAITGKLLWWQLLGAYLDLSSKREGGAANEYLQAFSYAGKLHQQKTGDPFVIDLAEFYESSTSERLAVLAKAHALIDRAHALLARSETDRAMECYTKARDIFRKAGDKLESWFAGYWVSYCHYRKSEFKGSLLALSQLAEHSRKNGHLWLLSSALTMVANIRAEFDQFSLSLVCYQESLEISERIKDEYNVQKNLTSLAYNYKNLGDHKESLSYLQRGLERAANCWPGKRQMYRNFDTAAGIFNTFGYYAAAAEYEKAALQQALEAKDPVFEHRSYVHLAAIYSELPNHAGALQYAERSYQVAKTILDERTDPRSIALSSLQLGHIYRKTQEYDKAAAYYDAAIRLYQEINLYTFLYEAHKGRLLCYIAQGNDELAAKELRIVLAFFEEHRAKIREEKNRNSFFDLEQYVYDIAIDFEYSIKHDVPKAFEYSETSRARSLLDLMRAGAEGVGQDTPQAAIISASEPLMLERIREKMPEEVQILQYSVLHDKLLIWVITKTRFEVAEEKITAISLTEKVLAYWKAISNVSENDTQESRRKAIALYEILIKPVKSLLKEDLQICIVPDKALNYLPFNALISSDTGNYLVSDYVLSFAPSSNTFLVSSDEALKRSGARDERVLTVGNPRFNRRAFYGLADLPDSGREAEEVARCYESASCLVEENARKERIRSEMGKADVIHIASHYVIDEHNPMLSKLLLTSRAGGQVSDGVLHGYEISKTELPVTRLVALSACRTGVERYYKGEGMIGMSRTFLAAGVPLVAASLWPIASDATTDLMVRFHQYRRAREGHSTAAALRQAQLDLINDPQQLYNGPYYWAPFIIIGGYASF